MDDRTTIAIPTYVRNRLRTYGRKGDTYEQVLQRLMDLVSPEEFLDGYTTPYSRTFTNAEIDAVRKQPAEERLRLAEEMRLLPSRVKGSTKRANARRP